MIEEKCIKILGRYLRVSSVYGFVRGWNADYEYNGFSNEIKQSADPNSLIVHRYMNKMINGTMNGILYGTFGNLSALYRCLCRIEIATTDKDPYDYPEYYTEMSGGIITLPPRPFPPNEKD